MIFAVDFDGTLCVHDFPRIGEPNMDMIQACKNLLEGGNELVLWTCRHGTRLQEAVDFCASFGLVFTSVNENTPSNLREYGSNPRKVYADYYIDDKNASFHKFKILGGVVL